MAQGEIRVMSRVEINTRRLLGRCELMAKEDSQRYWKLEKYILALDELLKRLQIQADKPPRDTMSKYIKRIDFLKGIVETAKIPGPIERVVAAQMLPKTSNLLSETASPSITTQIHQKTTAKYNRDVRAELFNSDGVFFLKEWDRRGCDRDWLISRVRTRISMQSSSTIGICRRK
uniref:Vesicle transport protein USE1 n=1 Tax=Fopius arisanus TaxID=64838 RepID=A0A0C9RAD8_9HYME